jgi:hypothetical protein
MPATEAHLKKFGKTKKGLRGFMQGVQSDIKGKIQSNTPKAVAGKFSPKRVQNPFARKKEGEAMTDSSAKSTEARSAENRDFPVVPTLVTGGGDVSSSHGKDSEENVVAFEKDSSAKEDKFELEAAAAAAASTTTSSTKQQEEEPRLKSDKSKDVADALILPDVECMSLDATSSHSKTKHTPMLEEELKLVIEIVAARGILIGDKTSSGKFVF